MSSTLTLSLTPLFLLISLPLFLLAIFTTTLAFSTLLIRVLIVYFELAIAVIHNHLTFTSPLERPTPPAHRPKSHRSISTSQSSSGSLTPRLPAPGSAYFPTTPLARDFEGVGGWRFPDPDDDDDADSVWTGMNSRLELPALGVTCGDLKNKHERSLTVGTAMAERPGFRRAGSLRARPFSAFVSGTTSPEEVCADSRMSKSNPDLGEGPGSGLGMNVGKVRGGQRKNSVGSTSTGRSGKTLKGQGLGW